MSHPLIVEEKRKDKNNVPRREDKLGIEVSTCIHNVLKHVTLLAALL